MNADNRIEEFIRTNRAAFDHLEAPTGLWRKIDRDLRPRAGVHPLWKWAAVAASAMLLVSVGYLFGSREDAMPAVAGWAEYQEAEKYYANEIAQKMDEIRLVGAEEQVLEDMKMLDAVYAELRQQLFDDPNADPQVILSAMIRHQQQKLDLMEKILNRIDKYQRHEGKAHPM
jgi:hypothetical protein